LAGTHGWIGLGFSDDTIMGKDLCVICVKANGGTYSFFSWNPDKIADSRYIDPNDLKGGNLSLKAHTSTNKKFYCEFETSNKIEYNGNVFDLVKDKFHILLAQGDGSVSNRKISDHTPKNRWASRTKESLLNHKSFSKSSNEHRTLDKIHGILMVISFMFFMSVGAFVSRFFKQTLIEVKVGGRRFWFIAHMGCMYCSVALTFTALILILVSRVSQTKGIFPPYAPLRNHAYVGLAACVIMLFQSTVIWWTPSFRKTLTFLHSCFGILTFYLGWYCITFSNHDTYVESKNIWAWGIAWICLYLLFFIGMTFLQLWDDRNESPESILPDPYRALKIPMKITSLSEDPNQALRLVILGLFISVCFVLTVCAAIEVGASIFYS